MQYGAFGSYTAGAHNDCNIARQMLATISKTDQQLLLNQITLIPISNVNKSAATIKQIICYDLKLIIIGLT